MKKLNLMRTDFMKQHKSGKKHHATDFMDIHKYRRAVNQNISRAIGGGIFNQIKDLNQIGNLMEYEDKHVF